VDALMDLFLRAVEVVNEPRTRFVITAISLLFSFFSLYVSIWAARRTTTAMKIHSSSLRAEHARFIETQWKAVNESVLANPDSAKLMAQMFGLSGEQEARQQAFLFMFLNILAMAFDARKHGALDQYDYDSHMRYFFSQYRGSLDHVLKVVKDNYSDDFLEECEKYVRLRTSIMPKVV
jgi:hypothetical protein